MGQNTSRRARIIQSHQDGGGRLGTHSLFPKAWTWPSSLPSHCVTFPEMEVASAMGLVAGALGTARTGEGGLYPLLPAHQRLFQGELRRSTEPCYCLNGDFALLWKEGTRCYLPERQRPLLSKEHWHNKSFWRTTGPTLDVEVNSTAKHPLPQPLKKCHSLHCFPKQHTYTSRYLKHCPGCPSHWLGDATQRHKGTQKAGRPFFAGLILQCFHPMENWNTETKPKTSQRTPFQAPAQHATCRHHSSNCSQEALTAGASGLQPSWREVCMNLETFYDLNNV